MFPNHIFLSNKESHRVAWSYHFVWQCLVLIFGCPIQIINCCQRQLPNPGAVLEKLLGIIYYLEALRSFRLDDPTAPLFDLYLVFVLSQTFKGLAKVPSKLRSRSEKFALMSNQQAVSTEYSCSIGGCLSFGAGLWLHLIFANWYPLYALQWLPVAVRTALHYYCSLGHL